MITKSNVVTKSALFGLEQCGQETFAPSASISRHPRRIGPHPPAERRVLRLLLFDRGVSRHKTRFFPEPFTRVAHYRQVTTECLQRLSLVRPEAASAAGRECLTARTDDDLMLLARGGVAPAFEALVRRHQLAVLNVAARLVGRSTLAPDLAQNTFLAVYRALPQYQARGKFTAYLYRVLLNQCRTLRRSAQVEGNALAAFAHAGRDDGPAADDQILARERQRQVESALGHLSPKLREVVVLRYSAGLSYDEIADALGTPLGTVKRRLFDAMGKLRHAMEDA